jgi:glyoxylase-like metal-dependent hydrolase (beta-lactamase superfamily II)
LKKSYFELVSTIVAVTFCFAVARANAPTIRPRATWHDLGRGVWVVPEIVAVDREPDGNSVIFSVASGLVVFDTGRHEWHRNSILALANTQKKPIVAIVNSHWHLDHVSGNPTLRARYPGLRVYASDAIDGALTGFLADSAKESAKYVDDPQIPEAMREDIQADLGSIQNGASLKPDEVIAASRDLQIGGRTFRVNLARDAATHEDIWIYDPASGVAALGDLVTFPAPYLDTACPEGWSAALKVVVDTPFKTAIPGHGPVLTRAQVVQYQHAFDAFVACSASPDPPQLCANQWAESLKILLAGQPFDAIHAGKVASYYVDLLRANGGKSRYCQA